MKHTATTQRRVRWSLACAYLAMPLVGLGDGLVVRPIHLNNRFAPRGSAVV